MAELAARLDCPGQQQRSAAAPCKDLFARIGFVPAAECFYADSVVLSVIVCYSMQGDEGSRVRKNALGLGLLLGGAVFSYGRTCGCSKAEILAINDDGKHTWGLGIPGLAVCFPSWRS